MGMASELPTSLLLMRLTETILSQLRETYHHQETFPRFGIFVEINLENSEDHFGEPLWKTSIADLMPAFGIAFISSDSIVNLGMDLNE